MRRRLSVLAAVLLLASACSPLASPGPPQTAPVTPSPKPEKPAFDVAKVVASFTAECEDPIIVDDLFCVQVHVADMTGERDLLTVPTTLNALARDRALVICDQIARAHFDGSGQDLGYAVVNVLDKDGGNAAACVVD